MYCTLLEYDPAELSDCAMCICIAIESAHAHGVECVAAA